MAKISWLALVLWLVGFTTLGLGVGWAFKGLTVERRECRWCDAPTETPKADYCRRHAAEVQAQLEAIDNGY